MDRLDWWRSNPGSGLGYRVSDHATLTTSTAERSSRSSSLCGGQPRLDLLGLAHRGLGLAGDLLADVIS
jgi:hypothetical protein